MSAPNRLFWPFLFLIVLVVIAIVAVPARNRFQRHKAIEAIRQSGGTVMLGPSTKSRFSQAVIGADLRSADVDTELLQTLSQFQEIERLNLEGVKLQPQDWELLGHLPQLQSLSLSESDVTDAGVSQLSLAITNLTLNGTSITDQSMQRVAAMTGLVSLDISDTRITADGLRLLEPLRSLEHLWIGESSITAESVESLRRAQPQHVGVAVSEGMGRRTHELLSVCEGPNTRGYHRDGYVLWAADTAWGHSLAGVVEAVVSEIGLDAQQAAKLLAVLGTEMEVLGNEMQDWGPTIPDPLPMVRYFESPSSPDRGIEIASADEFVRELQKDLHQADTFAVRRFARERFTAGDVPKLLAAIRATPYSAPPQRACLFCYGPFLLVRHGIDDPEVVAELDRLLAHEDGFIRANTICTFGYGGASPFYSRDEWTASKAADAWAVTRLPQFCRDQGYCYVVRIVLTEIALRRPEYAAEVMPALVEQIEMSEQSPCVEIARLAEVDADAAIAVVPSLRGMLKQLDEQIAHAPAASLKEFDAPRNMLGRRRTTVLEALSATAHQDPQLAHEIALEYLSRMKEGQPAGPFATLLSPDTPDANRIVVMALLDNANVVRDGPQNITAWRGTGIDPLSPLARLAKAIRDWRAAADSKGD